MQISKLVRKLITSWLHASTLYSNPLMIECIGNSSRWKNLPHVYLTAPCLAEISTRNYLEQMLWNLSRMEALKANQ